MFHILDIIIRIIIWKTLNILHIKFKKDDFQNQKTSQDNSSTFNFIQKNQIESETKAIQEDPHKILTDKRVAIKNPAVPSPDIKTKATQSDYTIPNITAIQTHPVRVITPQGDVIKYNNPNAKLQNFQFDKNVNVEKIFAEKKEQEKPPPVARTEVRDGILGSPDNRFAWPKQQQPYRDFKTYQNFPKNVSRNPIRKFSRDRMSPNPYDKPQNYDVPSSPLQVKLI